MMMTAGRLLSVWDLSSRLLPPAAVRRCTAVCRPLPNGAVVLVANVASFGAEASDGG